MFRPSGLQVYLVAIGAVAASLLFRYGFRDVFGLKVPFLQFYPAIILAAWYGGLRGGILATALASLAAMYFLLPPAGSASVRHRTNYRSLSSSEPGS